VAHYVLPVDSPRLLAYNRVAATLQHMCQGWTSHGQLQGASVSLLDNSCLLCIISVCSDERHGMNRLYCTSCMVFGVGLIC
jgi:hypothetical protein